MVRLLLNVVLGAAVVGCASRSRPPAASAERPASAAVSCNIDQDRAAIRAMAGEFRVSFAFDETDVVAAGYTRHGPYRANAQEVVALLEDTDRRLVLQHILLVKGADGGVAPMKHWRQDWTFEDPRLLEYRGHDTWERQGLAPEDVTCAWSQAVYEVTDAPRYESIGRWSHHGGESVWTSRETWRPLPRREYTKRSDYDVLLGTNRHVVTVNGWTHEQDNVKLVLEGSRKLVRERGENRYERARLEQAQAARDYLRDTGAFWGVVRDEWSALLAARTRLTLVAEIDGKPLYELLFPLADSTRGLAAAEQRRQAHDAIVRFIQPASAPSTAQLSREDLR